MVLDAALARARYSASIVERATALYFFELHEIGLHPRNVMYADVEVLSSMFPTQSASLYVGRHGAADFF